uniref:Myosin motor domain-containing protein n=1 Tax=Panagrellus redivivus TaxID=6233 RepID=A0A7E4VFX9_PANRE
MDYENDPGWQYLRRSREEMMADQSKPYDSKKNVWIPDVEEGYLPAEIKSTKGAEAVVVVGGGLEKTVKAEILQEMNPPKFEKTEDMSNLTFLNDASVLHNLRARYGSMLIYTYSGLFCVVINPYKRLPIYTDSVARMFMGKRRTEMPPHLFAVSDEAYRNMLQDGENQSMLITGESGAGKTENTKKVIAYFASVGASQTENEQRLKGITAKPAASDAKKVTLEDQIVQTNPVLESFGNAKTVRNNNSSRFGKFIRIHFSKKGRVASCDIEHYLLEKSRVIRQAPGERCYHIFYQVFTGYVPKLKEELMLDKPVSEYWFVAQAELTVDGIDDKEEAQLTDEAFRILRFSDQEIKDVYKLVSAMMHMGNMKFKQRPREEQAETDGTDEAEKAAAMYGVSHEEFLKALTRPRVKVGTEWVNKGQNLEQVNWAVGAMAKGLYSRIFNFLVKKCNITLDQKGIPRDHFIGVLDIAGFEIFDFNSFEQLWINFVNEKLQQFFNHHMFVLEQEEYQREGIQWTFIDFGLDLAACIELIEKPMGIIAMLDEECIVPKASDQTLAQKLIEQHLGKHPNFEKPKPPKGKQAEAHFAMRHYAGTVRYNVMNWLEKNKDPVNDTVVTVFKASKKNDLLVEIWQDFTTQEEAAAAEKKTGTKKKGKGGSFMTVSMMYRESLNKLMTMLHSTHPHFIRCLIPNEKKQSGVLDASLVLNQLTCNGVLEGIRICRKGFPNRTFHPDFVQRYAILAANEAKASGEPVEKATKMMARIVADGVITEENFRIGKTKVFFKAGIVAALEDQRDIKLAQLITGFQAQIRWNYRLIDVRRRRAQIEALKIMQKNVRKFLQLQTWVWYKLFGAIKPLMEQGKEQEILDKLADKVGAMAETVEKEKLQKAQLEESAKRLAEESAALIEQLGGTRGKNQEFEERLGSMSSSKTELEKSLAAVTDKLAAEEERTTEIQKNKKKIEQEADSLKKNVQELDLSLKKAEADKQSKENMIRSLQEEMNQQNATLAKIAKERKMQEELNKKMNDDLKNEEERGGAAKSLRAKLQQSLETIENEMEREKRVRSDAEKTKRKIEGELRIAQETIEELVKQRADTENSLKRKEADLYAISVRLEDQQSATAKLQRQLKDNEGRIRELEAEVESESQARARAERAKTELQQEIDDFTDQLEQQRSVTTSQIESNKKKDAELAKLRRDADELNLNFENQATSLKKKGSDQVAELNEQIDLVSKLKAKADKERTILQRQVEEANSVLDEEAKQRVEHERRAKQFESQLMELRLKSEEQIRQIQDLSSVKNRLQGENGELSRSVEELDSQINQINRLKSQYTTQLEDAKRLAAEEMREKQSLNILSKNLIHEVEQLRDSLEEEIAGKSDLLRQLSRAQAEAQQWKARLESESLVTGDEMDDLRRKQLGQIQELQADLDAATVRLSALDKTKARLQNEAESAKTESDILAHTISQLEKKQKAFDKIVDEWRHKADDLQNELDAAQREARQQFNEASRLRSNQDQLAEHVEGLRRENKGLATEIREMQDALGDGGRNIFELQKAQKRLEVEKEELQHALDEAEAALEAEESKVLRAQVEVQQIRAEIEKRVQEKEEEFENTRKNHQRAIETLQASLEAETKNKADLLRAKKKLEADINELEIALDHANKANEDAQKNIRRYLEQIKEIQQTIGEEQRRRDEFREKYVTTDKKLASAKGEHDELVGLVDGLERVKKHLEVELNDLQIQNNELRADNAALHSAKSKLDGELALLRADYSEAANEVATAEDRSKRASFEAAKLAEELKNQQERSNAVDRHRKNLEYQTKEMQVKIEEAEQAALKGGAKIVAKLEGRLKAIETEFESEQRRHADAAKNLSKSDRKGRELQFQVEEERKNYEKLCDLVEKLQAKIKVQRRLIDEAEESANLNLQKYRQIQIALEHAEERADTAEGSLNKMRSRTRGVTKSATTAL